MNNYAKATRVIDNKLAIMRFSTIIYFLSLIVLFAAVWYGRGTLRKRVTLVVDKVSQALAQNPGNQDNRAALMQNTNSNSQGSPLGLEESEEEEFEEELKAEKFTLDESLFVFPNQQVPSRILSC